MSEKQIESDLREGSRPHTPPFLIGVFWLLTLLPLAWGIYNTVLQAMKLLR
jgi:hypothetical protein